MTPNSGLLPTLYTRARPGNGWHSCRSLPGSSSPGSGPPSRLPPPSSYGAGRRPSRGSLLGERASGGRGGWQPAAPNGWRQPPPSGAPPSPLGPLAGFSRPPFNSCTRLALPTPIWTGSLKPARPALHRQHRTLADEDLQREVRRLTALEARCEAARLHRLLNGWRRRALHLTGRRRQREQADRHWRGVAGRALLAALELGVRERGLDPRMQRVAAERVRRMRLASYFRVGRVHQLRLPAVAGTFRASRVGTTLDKGALMFDGAGFMPLFPFPRTPVEPQTPRTASSEFSALCALSLPPRGWVRLHL